MAESGRQQARAGREAEQCREARPAGGVDHGRDRHAPGAELRRQQVEQGPGAGQHDGPGRHRPGPLQEQLQPAQAEHAGALPAGHRHRDLDRARGDQQRPRCHVHDPAVGALHP